MKEAKKDLFDSIYEDDVDAICITTNGHYTIDGKGVMGGGCAGECRRRWPETCSNLGRKLKGHGVNIPYLIGALDKDGNYLETNPEMLNKHQYKCLVFSFPTIDTLVEGSKLSLIKSSAQIMAVYADQYKLNGIVIPRPGVGIGGLKWSDVKPEIDPLLDDRFTIVSFDHEE